MKASKWLRDNWISQYTEIIGNWVKQLFPDYGVGSFWAWILAPHLFDLISFAN